MSKEKSSISVNSPKLITLNSPIKDKNCQTVLHIKIQVYDAQRKNKINKERLKIKCQKVIGQQEQSRNLRGKDKIQAQNTKQDQKGHSL